MFNRSGKSWSQMFHHIPEASLIKGISQQLNIILHFHKPSVVWHPRASCAVAISRKGSGRSLMPNDGTEQY